MYLPTYGDMSNFMAIATNKLSSIDFIPSSIELLHTLGADINIEDRDGNDALDHAKKRNFVEIVAILRYAKKVRFGVDDRLQRNDDVIEDGPDERIRAFNRRRQSMRASGDDL